MNSKSFEKIVNSQYLTIGQVSRAHLSGIGLAFLLGFLLTLTSSVLFGLLLLPWLIGFIPLHYDKLFEYVGISFLGVGCAVLIYMYIKNVKYWWLIIVSLFIGLFVF